MRSDRLIACCAVASFALATAAVGEAIEVRVESRGVLLPGSGELLVLPQGAVEPVILPLSELVEIAAPLPAEVTCRGEGLWCPKIELGAVSASATLPVYPSVEVTARLAGPAAGATLRKGSVQGVVRDGAGPQPLEFRHDLDFEGTEVRFDAPRAPLDLRFAFPGAAPVYRWSLGPPEGTSVLDLGTLTLLPGASVSGWLLSEDPEAPIAEAHVSATRLGAEGAAANALRKVEERSNARGFFQLHGLDPGTYRLEVDAEGFARKVLEVVELPEAAETLLGTIHLGPPILVSVQVRPPRHPGGEAWTLALRPVHARPGDLPLEAPVDAAGVGRVRVDRAGDYYLQVLGPDGDALHLETRELSHDEWLLVEVPVVAVAGTVRLGGEPVAATVRLQGGAGDRSDLRSDEDGRLTGWMRKPERPWLMADVGWEEAGRPKQRTVEILPEVDDDGEVVEIAIDLPAGVISGEVVDQQGAPQRGVRVVATPEDGASRYTVVSTRSDSTGRFHLTGLNSTRYLVQAGGNGGPASELVPVFLDGHLPIGEAHLVLRPTRRVTLHLTIDGQPAMGADVVIVGLGPAPVSLSGTTDAGGRASFDLPESVGRVVATLVDPSRWLWSGCVAVDSEEVRLDLPAAQLGALAVELSGRMDMPPLLEGEHVLWTEGGGFVSQSMFIHWSRLRGGGPLVERDEERVAQMVPIPALASGRYGVSWSGAPEWELGARACAGAAPADAEWTTVPPGGEAELSVDVSKRQERRLREMRQRARR